MGKPKEASDTLKQTFVLTILLGLVVSLFAGFASSSILRFMGAEAEVVTVGTPYFRVVAFGFVFNSPPWVLASALPRCGRHQNPMTVNMVANVINVVFNWIPIWGKFGFPKWGVFGAGVATTFSRSVAAVWFLIVALKGDRAIRLDFSENTVPTGVSSAGSACGAARGRGSLS